MQKKKKVFSKKDKLRVRNSYYTFTKEYPRGYVRIQRSGKRINVGDLKKPAFYALCFIAVVCLSYFAVSLALNISYKSIDPAQDTTELAEPPVVQQQGIRALYMPYTGLGDEEYIKSFVREIRQKNCNSVVIDFKSEEGRLAYTSLQENAIGAKCNLFDNDTVRRAMDIFSQADITVVARIFCLCDEMVPGVNPAAAVKYMNTDVNWHDSSDSSAATWLNPYSRQVRGYLAGIAGEINSFGINVFILEGLCFPDGDNVDSATYPGEKDQHSRNKALRSVLSSIKKALPENALVILGQSAGDAASGNEKLYYGTMTDADFYGVAVNTAERPLSIAVDKKTDYISVLSMYQTIAGRFGEKKLIAVIDNEEYSRGYIKAMAKAGFDSFILFDSEGEY